MDNPDDENTVTKLTLINESKHKDLTKGSYFKIITLSISFLCVFSAFTSTSMVSERVVSGYKIETTNDSKPFTGTSGYIVNAVLYSVFIIGNFIAPVLVTILTLKWSLILGMLSFGFYVSSYIHPVVPIMYLSCAMLGIGAGLMWVAQGSFMTLYSAEGHLQRDCSLFWTLNRAATITGNLFVYYRFKGVAEITSVERVPLFSIFAALCVFGSLLVFLIKFDKEEKKVDTKISKVLQQSSKLLLKKELLLALPMFLVMGFLYPFWATIYPTCIANSKGLGSDTDKLIGVHGICCGVGSVVAGFTLTFLDKRISMRSISILTTIVGAIIYIISYKNFSPNCSLQEVEDIVPNINVVYIGSFLQGAMDSLNNVCILTYVGSTFAEHSSAGFSLVHLSVAVAGVVSYIAAELVNFYVLVGFCAMLAGISCVSFLSAIRGKA